MRQLTEEENRAINLLIDQQRTAISELEKQLKICVNGFRTICDSFAGLKDAIKP